MQKVNERGTVPYTTKTGIQIGLLYQQPPATLSPEDELIQRVLLGQRMGPSLLEVIEWVVYGSLLVTAVTLLLSWGAKQ